MTFRGSQFNIPSPPLKDFGNDVMYFRVVANVTVKRNLSVQHSKTLFFACTLHYGWEGTLLHLINFQSIHYAINQPVYFSLLSPSSDLTAPSPIRRYCLLFFIALDSDELYLCRGKIDRKKGESVCQCGLFLLVLFYNFQ